MRLRPFARVHAGHAAHVDARLDQCCAHQDRRVQRVTGRRSPDHDTRTTNLDLARDQNFDVFASA